MPPFSFTIKPICPEEYPSLRKFLYYAIFVPPGANLPDFSVVDLPALRPYTEYFGSGRSDAGVVARANGALIGAAWCRVLPGFDGLDKDIPVLALSVLPAFRGRGVGTALLQALLAQLQKTACKGLALSVQRANPAVRLYRRLGFKTIAQKGEERIMLYTWRGNLL